MRLFDHPGNGEPVLLTDDELDLVAGLGIDVSIAVFVKAFSQHTIEGLYLRHLVDRAGPPELRGIKSRLLGLRIPFDWLDGRKAGHGIQIFGCGNSRNDMNTYVGLLRSEDRYDVLRCMETNGPAHDTSTEDIIRFLRKWEDRIPFVIAECDTSALTIKLIRDDDDLPVMIAEAAQVCPDLLAKEVTMEHVDRLVDFVRTTGEIYFWWD